jgi:hypothetical protein
LVLQSRDHRTEPAETSSEPELPEIDFDDALKGWTIIYEWLRVFQSGSGPTRTLAAAYDPKQREELERDFMAYFDGFANELGVAMPRARGTGVRKPLKRVLTPVAFQ